MKKLASQLRQKYPRDYSAIECLVISLSDVADFLDRCGDYKKSKKIQRYLSKLNKSLAYDTGLFDASEDLLINYQHLERTSEDYGDYSAALKYYRQSLAISEKMKEADGSDALYHRWLDDLYRVVHCYLQLHSPKQAEEYLRKSLEGYIALQSTGSETWRIYHALSSLKHSICSTGGRIRRSASSIGFLFQKGRYPNRNETICRFRADLSPSFEYDGTYC